MATEQLFASSHLSGTITNPTNALGNNAGTWAGDVDVKLSPIDDWAFDNPVDPPTPGATNHTVGVWCRKGSNSGNPTLATELWVSGFFVKNLLAATSVSSTTGVMASGSFTTDELGGNDGSGIEVRTTIVEAGGGPAARNSVQIEWIRVDLDTSPAALVINGTATSNASGSTGTAVGSATASTTSGTAVSNASGSTGTAVGTPVAVTVNGTATSNASGSTGTAVGAVVLPTVNGTAVSNASGSTGTAVGTPVAVTINGTATSNASGSTGTAVGSATVVVTVNGTATSNASGSTGTAVGTSSVPGSNDADFVTEAQTNALVTSVAANASTSLVYLDIGATAGAARTAGSSYQYWIADNGVTPTNAIEGDLVYNRSV